MGSIVVVLVVIVAMIALTALYVAAEFASISARKATVRQAAETGNRLAHSLLPIVEDSYRLDTYIAACQIGITVASLVLGYYGQAAIAGALAPLLVGIGGPAAAQSISTIVVLVLLTTCTVVLGELVPKSVALRYPEQTAFATVMPMRWSVVLFRPFIALFNGAANLILRAIGVPPASGHAHIHSPDEIELLVAESSKGGLLDSDERTLLTNAFELVDIRASQVMVPRTRLMTAPLTSSIHDVLSLATRDGYSRIPVYGNGVDDIVGIVHVRDLYRLYLAGNDDLRSVVRPVPFVPESLPASEVWNRLHAAGSYVAVVFDEYGGTAGLITIEDLIEEIFGEVEDEFDAEPMMLTVGTDGRVHLAGDTAIKDVNERYHLALPEGELQSVGGLVLDRLGRAPRVGDMIRIGDVELQVDAIDGNSVAHVALSLPAPPDAESGDEVPT